MSTDPAKSRRNALTVLRDESIRRVIATEKAVEHQFHDARLFLSLAFGLLLVGFLLVAQWRGNESYSRSLEAQSNVDLAAIIQQISSENDAMRDEALHLELRLMEAEAGGRGRSELLNTAARELKDLRVFAGLEAAAGPGVVVTLADPESVLLPSDLLAFVNELKAAGAEAIAVNGRRLAGRSGFSGDAGSAEFDGERLVAPYVVSAIGEKSGLTQAIGMPGGVAASFGTYPGVQVSVVGSDDVSVPAVQEMRFDLGEPIKENT